MPATGIPDEFLATARCNGQVGYHEQTGPRAVRRTGPLINVLEIPVETIVRAEP
ncbi:MAG: hypothetical protein Q7S58_01715 [Candidatus Binatus sp.]|uniref:hypothetical protein n=1 Tax=Candidatus Binatus sp. TaxID=2811406 RepID=UPI00271C3AFC|nr:hypothetical protein [Candidatus Binatus sp.]MDO8431107.1 hypothetical protein [Candidatus Binatus sp.]